jgi:hypothetical protein
MGLGWFRRWFQGAMYRHIAVRLDNGKLLFARAPE